MSVKRPDNCRRPPALLLPDSPQRGSDPPDWITRHLSAIRKRIRESRNFTTAALKKLKDTTYIQQIGSHSTSPKEILIKQRLKELCFKGLYKTVVALKISLVRQFGSHSTSHSQPFSKASEKKLFFSEREKVRHRGIGGES